MKFMSEEFSSALGLTILDAFWQGALLLIIALVFISLFKQVSPRIKYRLIVAIMLAMPIWSLISFNNHYTPVSNQDIDVPAVIMPENFAATHDVSNTVFIETTQPNTFQKAINWIQSNANMAAYFWLIGITVFGLRLLGGLAYVRILRKSAVDILDKHWNSRVVELSNQLKINRSIRFAESIKVNSPIVIGYLKPIVLFPLGLIQGMPTDQVEAILTHEMAHIKRADFLVNMLLSALKVIYFFHPAYWWLYAQAEQEREYHCDLLAINLVGSKLSLIKALASIQELQMPGLVLAPGFAKGKNQLLERVLRITEGRPQTNWLSGLISMILLTISFFLISWQNKPIGQMALTEVEQKEVQSVEKDSMKILQKADTRLNKTPFNLPPLRLDTIPKNKVDSTRTIIFENIYETVLIMAMNKYQNNLSQETLKLIEIVTTISSDDNMELYDAQVKALNMIKIDIDKAQEIEEFKLPNEAEWEQTVKITETLRIAEEQEHVERLAIEVKEELNQLEEEKREVLIREELTEIEKEREELTLIVENLESETVNSEEYLKRLKEEELGKKVEEVFKKELMKDELLADGWETLELTTKLLKIKGKKQSSSIHKKYLKLYEEVMSQKLKKGATFELREK
jgi:bla regulator protein blaR1